MIDYIISAILLIFIVAVLVTLRRREKGNPPRANGPGRRKVAEVTRVPRRIRVVSRANPARVIQASVGPGRPSASPIRR